MVNLIRHGTMDERSKAASILSIVSRTTGELEGSTISELIMLTGGGTALVDLINTGNEDQVLKAVMTICNIAVANNTGASNARAIGAAGAIKPLVAIVRHGSNALKEWSALALALVTRDVPKNRDRLGEEGGIQAAVELAQSGTDLQRRHAVMALLSAIDNHSENVELAAEGGAIPTLVELAKSATESTRQEAVMALARMCASSEEHLATITSAGGISADQAKQAANHMLRRHGLNNFSEPILEALADMAGILMKIGKQEDTKKNSLS